MMDALTVKGKIILRDTKNEFLFQARKDQSDGHGNRLSCSI